MEAFKKQNNKDKIFEWIFKFWLTVIVCTVHLRIYGSTCALRSVCSILTLKIKRKRKREKSKILRQYTEGLFICLAKSYFFVRIQIFLHADWIFLHPQELALHSKNDSCDIGVYKFGQKFFIIGIFWIFLCSLHKKTWKNPRWVTAIELKKKWKRIEKEMKKKNRKGKKKSK